MTADSLPDFALRLALANARSVAGDAWGVVRTLEGIDFSAQPRQPGADRAAFLLAEAYRKLGDHARFTAIADRVASWTDPSVYTEWLAWQRGLDRAEESGRIPTDFAARFPGASPLVRVMGALAPRDSMSPDADAPIRAVDIDTTSALGRDLFGALHMRDAELAAGRGEDPRSALNQIPAASRYSSRGRHLIAVAALDRGEREEGRRLLEGLLAEDAGYSQRREALQALAGLAMDAGRWDEAESLYVAVENDWTGQGNALARTMAERGYGRLWREWRSSGLMSNALALDGWTSDSLAARIGLSATAGADLSDAGPPPLAASDAALATRWPVAPPPLEAWNLVTASQWRHEESRAQVGRIQLRITEELDRLEQQRRYRSYGRRRIAQEDSLLRARSVRLDSLRATLDAWDARLRAVRDEAMRRVADRARSLAEGSATQRVAMRGMRHLHLEGPHRDRPVVAPPGLPGPDTLLATEEALAASIENMARRIEVEGPQRIARSYTEAWRPGLIDRVGVLGAEARASLAWANRLGLHVDSILAAGWASPALRRLQSQFIASERRADSLGRAHVALSDRVAQEAVERALAALAEEREGIDYGLAASSYAASVGLGATDSSALAGAPGTTGPRGHDNPELAGERAVALERLDRFLTSHPQSAARGEIRFRLADLTLLHAREAFGVRMAEYVKRQSEGLEAGALPLLTDSRALELYRAILREDQDFPHLDAVRFNAGMILADAGDPEAETLFADLVRLHPASDYAQEAYVRMGDMRFAERRFREAENLYARGGLGADLTLRAVATYKMGWAAFRDERFLDAATAFRDVMDLYASPAGANLHADVQHEAETYLVQALTRAGGAESFARLFESGRARPYEARILASLAQQFRHYDRLADAIAADAMALERYPLSADALLSARRMNDSYARWNDGAGGRDAMLQMAPRFAPASTWADAQRSDSVREAGAEFARLSWLAVASHHHRQARARDAASDWRSALELYETVLSRFPRDPQSAIYHLHAGEAAAHLERFQASLAHYERASRSESDSIRTVADWQQVAVADDWYSRRRNGRRESFEPQVDSLARAVLATADRYLDRHPRDPRGADLVWRQGQLAFAHEWFERAASDFGRLATRYPTDPRAPRAAAMRADAYFRLDRFAAAGQAYEEALAAANHAGVDSLAKRASAAIPICYYRDAEAAVAADSAAYAKHAALFEKVATRWPAYEHADVAQYRAGRAYLKAGAYDEAVRALHALTQNFPGSEFARDAHLEMARALEQQGRRENAADALTEFATRFEGDSSAADALLKAADLYEAAGKTERADATRLGYVRRFPADHETAMEVYEALARRELKSVGPDRPLSSLLPAPVVPVPAAGRTRAARAGIPAKKTGAGASVQPTGSALAGAASAHAPLSYLAQYMNRAETHPELASKSFVAEVRFRQGEELRAAAAAVALRLPLDQSLRRRQKFLDQSLASYRQSAAYGVAEWAHASACRIGQSLVEFGEALERSERPADLQGDNLLAYEDVLLDRSQIFYDRGEGVWVELLRQKGAAAPEDPWLTQAQAALWARLGTRFAYQPEPEYPLVAANAPERPRAEKPRKGEKRESRLSASRRSDTHAQGGTR